MFELISLSVNSVAALLTFVYIVKLLAQGVPSNSMPTKRVRVQRGIALPEQTRGALGFARNSSF
jgi:hypothetical protein